MCDFHLQNLPWTSKKKKNSNWISLTFSIDGARATEDVVRAKHDQWPDVDEITLKTDKTTSLLS